MSALRRSLLLTTGAAALYAAIVLFAGWQVGGRPPGWYEGKALVIPIAVAAALCEVLAIAGLIVALRALSRRAELPKRWTLAAAVCSGGLVNAALIIASFTPAGLVIAYEIAQWRQSIGL